jgi:hypothetical protein
MKPAEIATYPEVFTDAPGGVFRERIFSGPLWSAEVFKNAVHPSPANLPSQQSQELVTDPDSLYVAQRSPHNRDHEAASDFWNLLFGTQPRPQMLIVSGAVGTGKTTFLEYFFNVALPLRSQLEKPIAVFYSGLEDQTQFGSAKKKLRHDIKNCLMRQFPGIESEDDYAMWDRKVNGWNNPVHQNAALGEPKSAYRARLINTYFIDPECFLEEAIHYITQVKMRSLFVIVDNLDQMPERAIQEIVNELRELYANSIHICFILPLRPETKGLLVSRGVVPKGVEDFYLSAVDEEKLFARRASAASRKITESRKNVNRQIEYDTHTSYFKIWYGDAARRAQLAVEFSVHNASSDQKRAWSSICSALNNSTRKILRTRLRMISHPRFFDKVRQGSAISNYDIIEAALMGDDNFCGTDSILCDIINLFASNGGLADIADNQPDLVLMYYLLNTLRKTQDLTVVKDYLKFTGFGDASIDNALRVFDDKGVLNRYEDNSIKVHGEVIMGYIRLIKHVAYFECTAISRAARQKATQHREREKFSDAKRLFHAIKNIESKIRTRPTTRRLRSITFPSLSDLLHEAYRRRYTDTTLRAIIGETAADNFLKWFFYVDPSEPQPPPFLTRHVP